MMQLGWEIRVSVVLVWSFAVTIPFQARIHHPPPSPLPPSPPPKKKKEKKRKRKRKERKEEKRKEKERRKGKRDIKKLNRHNLFFCAYKDLHLRVVL